MRKILLSAIFFMQFTYFTAFANELLPIDAVLVLDVSRSMRTADPERISRDAMNLFIENLSENRDRVGVVAYAGNVEASLDLRELHSQQDREALRDFINALDYASWTDHGVGLLEAVRMLEYGREQEIAPRQGIIVFLTDGNLNVNPWGTRTNEEAQEDVYEAMRIAYSLGIPIHAIGLNFDGNLDCVSFIAEATNGLFFETANAEDIYEIIAAFFHAMIAAPQPVIEEPEPPPEPETEAETEPETHTPPESTYEVEYELEYKNEYENPSRATNVLVAVIGIVVTAILTAFLFAKTVKRKRVFTGKIVLEADGVTRSFNLIEFGNRVLLGALLENAAPAFDYVILTPSPTTPSHLPQLQIKCKNRDVTLTKDFTRQDIAKGISITNGTEVTISANEIEVRLKFLNAH